MSYVLYGEGKRFIFARNLFQPFQACVLINHRVMNYLLRTNFFKLDGAEIIVEVDSKTRLAETQTATSLFTYDIGKMICESGSIIQLELAILLLNVLFLLTHWVVVILELLNSPVTQNVMSLILLNRVKTAISTAIKY